MAKKQQARLPKVFYFVDEAGDDVIFNKRGKVIVGEEGNSNYFILGALEVGDPESLSGQLEDLRTRLLADPYLNRIPSMTPTEKKTALVFHAKDDVPEVRRDVFSLLRQREDLRFFAIVKDKRKLVKYIRDQNAKNTSYRYRPNDLYDSLVSRLFTDRLHKADEYDICFARRGSSDRTKALADALQKARQKFDSKWNVQTSSLLNVTFQKTAGQAGLQVVDYFLWSLQRLYERREDRYFQYLWPAFSLVIDVDDRRKANYGVYYSQTNPLTLDKLEEAI